MAIETDKDGQPLSLPFDPEQTAAVRLRQADIARLFEVSGAAVSQWVKAGKITTYADGTIDPARAARELAKNCDIRRLRAKGFRPLRDEVQTVRDTLRTALAERDELRDLLHHALELLAQSDTWLEVFAAKVDHMDGVEALFDEAGKEACAVDIAAALARIEDGLAEFYRPELALDSGGDISLAAGEAEEGRGVD